MAAILAMVPLSRSAFWGPMAITIMGGLFVATFLTLLFLPSLMRYGIVAAGERGGGEGELSVPFERTQQSGERLHSLPSERKARLLNELRTIRKHRNRRPERIS
jgi:hypothetical protein